MFTHIFMPNYLHYFEPYVNRAEYSDLHSKTLIKSICDYFDYCLTKYSSNSGNIMNIYISDFKISQHRMLN